jgi:hypothetical protein
MHRFFLILALALAFLGAGASSTLATNSPPVGYVRIEYYGHQDFAWMVQALTAELNAVTANLPRAPHFYMVDYPSTGCAQMQWPVPARVYQICTSPFIAGANGLTWADPVNQRATVQVENSAATWPYMKDLFCHELVHATTGALDGPFIYPDTSCMRGYLDTFGYWDWLNMRWWWG